MSVTLIMLIRGEHGCGHDLYYWASASAPRHRFLQKPSLPCLMMPGPKDTPYDGGLYQIDIQLDDQYPFAPPKMRFITKVWHPNVSSQTGAICLDILKDMWSPALTLKTALLSLQALLSSPQPDDPQDGVVAKVRPRPHPCTTLRPHHLPLHPNLYTTPPLPLQPSPPPAPTTLLQSYPHLNPAPPLLVLSNAFPPPFHPRTNNIPCCPPLLLPSPLPPPALHPSLLSSPLAPPPTPTLHQHLPPPPPFSTTLPPSPPSPPVPHPALPPSAIPDRP